MSELLKQVGEFLDLFDKLKKVAGDPKRLAAFYGESSAIRDAAEKLENSALELDRHRHQRCIPTLAQTPTIFAPPPVSCKHSEEKEFSERFVG